MSCIIIATHQLLDWHLHSGSRDDPCVENAQDFMQIYYGDASRIEQMVLAFGACSSVILALTE